MAPSSLDKALHLHRSGRLKEAERLYLQVLKASPAHEDARRLLAVLKHQSGRSSEALADLDRLLASRPLFPEALANRGVVLAALGRADEAEAAFRQALELVPGFPDAVLQLARLLLAQERLDEVGRLLARAPQDWPVEKAALAHKLGAFDQAEAILRRALEARPDDAKLLEALVPVLTALGRHQEAIGTARAALALAPSQPALRHNLALALLGSGHLEEGWAEYAHRWDSPHFPSHQRPLKGPRWDGKADISSRSILVWREQGVGDEISFASALPDLIERAGRVVVECSSKLVPLFARSFPRALVRAEERGQVEGALETDFQMPIGDLFSIFRPRLERFTGQAYLSA
ncbi:MAG: tetratricopeptide repeat protein, partial [Rhodospirillales bacterium]